MFSILGEWFYNSRASPLKETCTGLRMKPELKTPTKMTSRYLSKKKRT